MAPGNIFPYSMDRCIESIHGRQSEPADIPTQSAFPPQAEWKNACLDGTPANVLQQCGITHGIDNFW